MSRIASSRVLLLVAALVLGLGGFALLGWAATHQVSAPTVPTAGAAPLDEPAPAGIPSVGTPFFGTPFFSGTAAAGAPLLGTPGGATTSGWGPYSGLRVGGPGSTGSGAPPAPAGRSLSPLVSPGPALPPAGVAPAAPLVAPVPVLAASPSPARRSSSTWLACVPVTAWRSPGPTVPWPGSR